MNPSASSVVIVLFVVTLLVASVAPMQVTGQTTSTSARVDFPGGM